MATISTAMGEVYLAQTKTIASKNNPNNLQTLTPLRQTTTVSSFHEIENQFCRGDEK
jgi:hypothetical protein